MTDLEASGLKTEIASLKQELAQVRAQAQAKDPRIDRLMQEVKDARRVADNAANWQNILRGENGITVQGNIIRLDTPKNERAHSEVTTTGCLNGQPGAAMNDAYTVRPYAIPPP